jgi:GT2 family glycosyltransferase
VVTFVQELVLDAKNLPAGWALVEGNLGRRGQHLASSMRLHLRADSGRAEEIPLAALASGRIFELIRFPSDVVKIVWRPPLVGHYEPSQLRIRRVGWIKRTILMVVRVVRTYLRLSPEEREECGLSLPRAFFDLPGAYRICTDFRVRMWTQPYSEWIERYDRVSEGDRTLICGHIERLASRPRFHLIVAANADGSVEAMRRTVASLKSQLYEAYDYTVVDPHGALAAGVPVKGPGEMAAWLADFNARLAAERSHDWVMLLRAGDTLPPHALYWFAWQIQAAGDAALVYSDDDVMDEAGARHEPRFKPDWSPEHLRAAHYVGSAAVARGAAIAAAGGIRLECCRHGNYDLLLRAVDAGATRVAHVPAVLYHRGVARAGEWENSASCTEALKSHLARNGVEADVAPVSAAGRHIRYRLPDSPPLVTIIIPTRDAAALLERCIQSLLEKTTYLRYEVLVVDNRSSAADALAYLERISVHPRVRVVRYPRRFNYSAINNFAARVARGEALCLLNNDTEVISPDWLEEMTGHLSQAGVGAVGAKLYYPDGRVQHAGVTVGPGGCASHLHVNLGGDAAGYCGRAMIAQELSAVTGACLLTWKQAYLRLGGLNEKRLTVAFNDVDYCLRLQEAGYRVVFTPHAQLYHHESATRGDDEPLARRLRARREVKYMRRRWRSRMRHDPYYNPNLSYRRPDFALGESARVRKPWLGGK